jgi:RNA polymerase sigma-B factor
MSLSCTLIAGRSESEMFARARAGDARARDALVERFMPMARSVARGFMKGAADQEDVLQVAALALVKAIDRYDPSYGTAFSSFAIPTISGELKRFFRDTAWGLRVPRALVELSLSVETAIGEIEPSLGRAPTPSEIAAYLRITPEEVVEALEVGRTRALERFDELGLHDDDDNRSPRARTLGAEDPNYALIDELATIGPAFAALPARERQILRLRFGSALTQREIAAELGVSQMHISRLIRKALDTMAELSGAREPAAQ